VVSDTDDDIHNPTFIGSLSREANLVFADVLECTVNDGILNELQEGM
jgi:hypothetical protein